MGKEWEQGPDEWVEEIRSWGYTDAEVKAVDGGVLIYGADGKQIWFDPTYLTRLNNLEPEFSDTTFDTDSIIGDLVYAAVNEGIHKMKQELAEYEAEARQWERPHKKRPLIDDPTGYRVLG